MNMKKTGFCGFFSRIVSGIRIPRKASTSDKTHTSKAFELLEEKLDKWVRDGKYRENYDSMDDIIRDLDITRHELASYCRTNFHKDFLSWRKELRIEEAKKILLEHKETPIHRISDHLGFGDKSNFRHQFKDIVGCTPSQWRQYDGKWH